MDLPDPVYRARQVHGAFSFLSFGTASQDFQLIVEVIGTGVCSGGVCRFGSKQGIFFAWPRLLGGQTTGIPVRPGVKDRV